MGKVFAWLKKEAVFTVAWVLAIGTAFVVPPDGAYAGYIDWHTLGLLFCLMTVMAGLQGLGLFRRLGQGLLVRAKTARQVEVLLVFLCFVTSCVVTNDVALITFVPFAITVLELSGLEERLIPVVVMQTIAANLGSMLTPIGNPQNLYLYAQSGFTVGQFAAITAPYAALSALLLALWLLLRKSQPVEAPVGSGEAPLRRMPCAVYGVLFLLSLGAVAKVVPVWMAAAVVLAAVLLLDRKALLRVDYVLLLTFAGFFIFVGNMGRMPFFNQLFRTLVEGREVLCAVVTSQVISNVPAALLLSGFTRNWEGLIVGTNLGGLGTLIASMASLISYKLITARLPEKKGTYLAQFTLGNLVFLAALLALEFFVG